MIPLHSFSTQAEKALANRLADQLAKSLPPNMIESRRKILSVNKVTRLLEQAYQVAAEHQAQAKMGWIKRAVLANTFRWELKDRGYPADFVSMAVEGLVISLTNARRKGSTTN